MCCSMTCLANAWPAKVEMVLCLCESTAGIEQRFSRMRMLRHDQKGKTCARFIRDAMKTNFDAPSGHGFCQKDQDGYKLSDFGLKVLRTYRDEYGGGRNGPKAELPRRTMKDRSRKTGLAAFMRERESQKRSLLQGNPADEPEDLCDLAAATSHEAKRRRTDKHDALCTQMKELAVKKRELLLSLPEVADQKLKEHQQKEKQVLRTLASKQVRSLQGAVPFETLAGVVVVLASKNAAANVLEPGGAGEEQAAHDDLEHQGTKQLLRQLGCRTVIGMSDPGLISELLQAEHTIWLGLSSATEKGMMCGNGFAGAMARLLGGYLAGESWVRHCKTSGRIVLPPVRLGRALLATQEVHLSKSVPFREGIKKIVAAADHAGMCKWTLRKKERDMPGAQRLLSVRLCLATATPRRNKTGWIVVADKHQRSKTKLFQGRGRTLEWSAFIAATARPRAQHEGHLLISSFSATQACSLQHAFLSYLM